MKKLFLIILLFAIACTSIAFAAKVTRPRLHLLTIDVSAFVNEVPVATQVSIIEIDRRGRAVPRTGRSKWSKVGHVRFPGIRKGKSYKIVAHEQARPLEGEAVDPGLFSARGTANIGLIASHTIRNIRHSTAIGLAIVDPIIPLRTP